MVSAKNSSTTRDNHSPTSTKTFSCACGLRATPVGSYFGNSQERRVVAKKYKNTKKKNTHTQRIEEIDRDERREKEKKVGERS